MIASQNAMVHELIGLGVLVIDASNPSLRGISGRIVDETKNMLAVQTTTKIKRIPKQHGIFRLSLKGNRVVEIDGSVLVLAPEKRISLHKRKRIL